MGSDLRAFAVPIIGVFVVTIVYSIVALANPKLVPFSNHPKEVSAVVPVTSPVTSPTSAGASPTSGATAVASATSGGGGAALTLVGQNILFDKTKLEAKAGPITIEFDNKDGGIPHNVHVFKGKDASGDSVGATDIAPGPTKQTLALELTAGDYFFQCDVHPTTMAGTLTVS